MTERTSIIKENFKRLYGEELTDEALDTIAKEVVVDRFRKYVKDNLNYEQARDYIESKPKKKGKKA